MITDQEHQDNLIFNAYHRENEIYSYQMNIDNYIHMIDAIPSAPLPESLSGYAKTEVIDLPLELSDDDVQLVTDFQYRNRLLATIRTERAEQGKATRIRDALKAQIEGDYDSAIASFKATQIKP
jgi:hypothetical protein